MKISELLKETPIQDYETLSDKPNAPSGGNWDTPPVGGAKISKDPADFEKRSSSFTRDTDKTLITHPKAVQKTKNMFANTEHDFHFYFANTKEARQHTEVGMVDRDWLDKNMPSIAPHIPEHEDGITVIFTNNKGAEGVPMSSWIIAHRIAHVLARYGGYNGRQISNYTEAEKIIERYTNNIFKEYYGKDIRKKDTYGMNQSDYAENRNKELMVRRFYEAIGTFRSARKNNLREPFEFLNELIAQQLITSTGIHFNPVPSKIVTKKAWGHDRWDGSARGRQEEEEYANELVDSMKEELYWAIDAIFGQATGSIFVM